MTRYHATSEGQIPFTPEEEVRRDAEEIENITKQAMATAQIRAAEDCSALNGIRLWLFNKKMAKALNIKS